MHSIITNCTVIQIERDCRNWFLVGGKRMPELGPQKVEREHRNWGCSVFKGNKETGTLEGKWGPDVWKRTASSGSQVSGMGQQTLPCEPVAEPSRFQNGQIVDIGALLYCKWSVNTCLKLSMHTIAVYKLTLILQLF